VAIPPSASVFAARMDPGDRIEFAVSFDAVLQTAQNEQIAAGWTLAMSAEGAALGVQIETIGGRAPYLDTNNSRVVFWLSVLGASQADISFNAGVDVAIIVRFETTNVPARRYERTVVVRIVNQ